MLQSERQVPELRGQPVRIREAQLPQSPMQEFRALLALVNIHIEDIGLIYPVLVPGSRPACARAR